eukprot:Gregarina_sp_Poly_1__9286@NODE_575_length_7472_cov_59_507225_g449_i0_p4_GENE_NODE_575_length_7472_cov_59_507225_g449_i0NODE_575_length_7472_cov_59_507225_g449_i0_p4_ORF_typecomplete_len258_score32_87_NODE_575_length_7472_cov_59_507225_g449_i056146387
MLQYCTSAGTPSKVTTLEGTPPSPHVSAPGGTEFIRQPMELKTEVWREARPSMPQSVQSTPRTTFADLATVGSSGGWRYAANNPEGSMHRLSSQVVAPQGTTLAERLQSNSDFTRRLTSAAGGATMSMPQEGTSLSETSGIIYCPEHASMDLTLVAPVAVTYPSSVPRFQAPVVVSESLTADYRNWETLVLEAEAAERATEQQEFEESNLDSSKRDVIDSETQSQDILANAVVTTEDHDRDHLCPIPPGAVLDDNIS